MGEIGFGRVKRGSSAQHFLLLWLFSFHSSGKLIFMHSLALHWDSLTWRLSALAYYTSSLFYPIQYISPYTIWPLNLPWNISRARCWKTSPLLAVICAALAAFSWQLLMIRGGLQHNELMLQSSTLKKIFQIIVPVQKVPNLLPPADYSVAIGTRWSFSVLHHCSAQITDSDKHNRGKEPRVISAADDVVL